MRRVTFVLVSGSALHYGLLKLFLISFGIPARGGVTPLKDDVIPVTYVLPRSRAVQGREGLEDGLAVPCALGKGRSGELAMGGSRRNHSYHV